MLNGNRTKSNRGRSLRDLYITPLELADAAIDKLRLDELIVDIDNILDPGCGTGVWGHSAKVKFPNQPCVLGIDLQPKITDNDEFYTAILTTNYLGYYFESGFDLICGNPPYSLAEEFIRHSFDLLEKRGYIYFLLRLSFLEGINRGRKLFKEFPIKRVYVCSRRPSFFSTNGKHTTDILGCAMFLWQKGYTGKTELNWLDWGYRK
jgi:hypothetical protein